MDVITYRVEIADAHAHLFRVTLRVPRPAAEQRLSLPVWIPGSYLVREFARHLSAHDATQGDAAVPLEQLDKTTWLARCAPGGALVVTWLVYAFDSSVRAAFLDARRGFFNPACTCLRVEGQERRPHRLELPRLPAGWQVATALLPVETDADGRGVYEASDYDELADSPFELGSFWRGRFEAGGAAHELVVTGALPDVDTGRLLADTRRICEAQIRFWHGSGAAPFARYMFLLNAVDDGHGGLEHRHGTALLAARRDLPSRHMAAAGDALGDGYANLLGLISHEYFHAWNVKRLRPAAFASIDYARENYTELLWFFEGFTSYYDDLFLLRVGLIDLGRYCRQVARSASTVLASPGRHVQSVAAASFDAWVKYYRSDENTPNATVSYYAKGALIALALDLTLRAEGRGTLDDVMRRLWVSSGTATGDGSIDEAAIAAALEQVGGRSYAEELRAWVHGTAELPLPALLGQIAIRWQHQPPGVAQRFGVRVGESALTGIRINHVQRGGAAERAGFAAGDELLAVHGWRLRRLDEALRLIEPGVAVPVLVARDQRVLELELTLGDAALDAASGAVLLQADAAADPAALLRQKAWLAG